MAQIPSIEKKEEKAFKKTHGSGIAECLQQRVHSRDVLFQTACILNGS
jgi:hypothetical protein